jgi:D-ribose pyranase
VRPAGLLHAELLDVIAALGHGQTLVIADAGLPIPAATRRIDLAVRRGSPAFLDVLEVVLEAGVFEAGLVADELLSSGPQLVEQIRVRLASASLGTIPHDELKRRAADAVAVVRTGEFTPYANIVLRAGVSF